MITGTVSRRHALVSLVVRGPQGHSALVEFVIDTGFTGVLTLPADACAALHLPFARYQPSGLADGSQVMLDVYEATLLWDGEERPVEVLAMDSAPLIGMTALDGSDVRLQVTEDGLVTIKPL